MKKLILVTSLVLASKLVVGQSSQLATQVFTLINEARENPSLFLEKHKVKIKKYNSRYLQLLQTATPLEAAAWDKALEQMARQVVEEGYLRPTYEGVNPLCGRSSGNSSGRLPIDPLEYVCELYTNIHDPDYQYIGLYFNAKKDGYSYQWGKSCQRQKISYSYTEEIDTSLVNYESLNTARDVDYMTDEEKKMLAEINFVRAYPDVYAQFISKYLADESQSRFGLTNDVYRAGLELIGELKKSSPLEILQPSRCVYEAAKLHGLDCQSRGFADHQGSDHSMPWDRIARQCTGMKGNENIVGNPSGDVRVPVIGLLLDAGISDRGHRYNMLDKNWKYGAIYKYDDPKTKYYWIQNFAH